MATLREMKDTLTRASVALLSPDVRAAVRLWQLYPAAFAPDERALLVAAERKLDEAMHDIGLVSERLSAALAKGG